MCVHSSIRRTIPVVCILFGFLVSGDWLGGQEKTLAKPETKPSSKQLGSKPVARAEAMATLKGRIVQHPRPDWKIDLAELKVELVEFVMDRLPEPELPDDWAKMTNDQRIEWITKFEASEEGKKLLAEQERILESAKKFDVPIEASGDFVIFDVPPGTYGISGRMARKIGEYQYVFEVFGQIIVRDDVDEVLLDPIPILVTPQFQPGQPVPPFTVQSADGEKIIPKDFEKQFLFINVWSDQFSPPSVAFQAQVQEMAKALGDSQNLQLLSVCLNEDTDKGKATIREKQWAGAHGFAPGWDHPFAETLGVRTLPWFMLVDPEGKIRLTHAQIRTAFTKGKRLQQIVGEGIQGRDPAADEANKATDAPDESK